MFRGYRLAMLLVAICAVLGFCVAWPVALAAGLTMAGALAISGLVATVISLAGICGIVLDRRQVEKIVNAQQNRAWSAEINSLRAQNSVYEEEIAALQNKNRAQDQEVHILKEFKSNNIESKRLAREKEDELHKQVEDLKIHQNDEDNNYSPLEHEDNEGSPSPSPIEFDNDENGSLSESGGYHGRTVASNKKQYLACYYDVGHMQEVVYRGMRYKYPESFKINGALWLRNDSRHQPIVVLPAFNAAYKNQEEFMMVLKKAIKLIEINKLPQVKIIYPTLIKQHWYTSELNFMRKKNEVLVHGYLHDPRGGGHMKQEIIDFISPAFQSVFKEKTSFIAPVSPYRSCRQSPVDKMSCGPIVAHEIAKLVAGKNLNRRIPYAFGATNIVKKHSLFAKSNSLKSVINSRYSLLANISNAKNNKAIFQDDGYRNVDPSFR